jgi:predicted phosphodiesterase
MDDILNLKREIIVVGDTELGAGTLTDDFISDKALSNLILEHAHKDTAVDFIFNGDTFDFLKCPYIIDGKHTYPRHITSEISIKKFFDIYKAHKPIFAAMKKFVKSKNNRIFFIIGNHDPDLVFEDLQGEIKDIIDAKGNVFFRFEYNFHNVYAEHGHQYDFLNKVNKKRLFIKYKREKILNIPWVSFGLISNFMSIKEQFPFSERIKPWPKVFSHQKVIVKTLNWRAVEYIFKTLFYYPIRYFADPTHRIPRELFREFYRRAKNSHWDVDKIVNIFKRKHKRKRLKTKIHILGHVHEKYIEEKKGKVIIHPDTWRDEYTFLDDDKLVNKTKNYVKILVHDNDAIQYKLIEYPIKRKIIKFKDIIANEKNWIMKVAKEEGYKGLRKEIF